MKVMLVCPHYGPPWNEGVKNIVRVLDEQLTARGIETLVFAGSGMHHAARPRLATLPSKLAFWARAARHARRERVDLVHLMSSINPAAGLKSFVLRQFSGIPLVMHFTGRARSVSGYRLMMQADRVLVGGDHLLPYFERAISVPPLTPYLGSSEPVHPVDTGDGPRRLLYLGAMEEVRGVHNLIAALAILRDELGFRNFALTIAWNGYGEPGYPERIRSLIAECGLEPQVHWQTGQADVPALYRAHEMVVVPRLGGMRMTFPLRLIEAMSFGRPVIASDIGEMPRIVQGCGQVYPHGDEPALAGALHRLLTDGDLYRACAEGAVRRAAEFDPVRTVDTIVNAYEELVNAA